MTRSIVTEDKWYEVQDLDDGISLIHEPAIRAFFRCNMWFVRGRDRDLLFDTGLGAVPLRSSVPLLTGRPIICVASHTHFDHIGNHHEFDDRCVHCAEAAILADPRKELTLADRYATDDMFDAFPPNWDAAAYRIPPAPAGRLLQDGDVVDLGDRRLQVIHTPGHSPGGIALWERETGTLLSGDIVYDGPLIDDTYHADLDDYAQSLEHLCSLDVRTVHGGHFPSFGHERLRALTAEYLAGRRKPGCHLGS